MLKINPKIIRLLLTFYGNYALVASLITVSCLSLYWRYGIQVFTEILWFKILTCGVIYAFLHPAKRKEFYYYQNLGISKVVLWAASLIFDLLLFIFLVMLIHHAR